MIDNSVQNFMMQRFRKIGAVRASLQITAGLKKSANVAKFSTWMTDTVGVVQEKPRDDGFKYYKSAKDIEREKIMDAEFERILNSYATSEDKQKLIQLLGKSVSTFIFHCGRATSFHSIVSQLKCII